ncbi:MAG: AbgT family transporter [Anaerotignum sp.]|nr:AbgT family transporter [Anaerotignum sp.]
MNESHKGKKTFPHTFIVLFALVVFACILTYLIPAGQFERIFDETVNQTLVVPGSYTRVAQQPVAPWLLFHKFYEALSLPKTASLMWLIFITGGAFEIIIKTGCFVKICSCFAVYFHRRELWIIPVFVAIFSIFGFTMGMTTASVAFVPLGIAVATSLGMDRLTGIAMISLGVNAGFTAGIFNPFSVGTAQMIAELPLFSGSWLRWLTLPVLIFVTSAYIMFHAKRQRVMVSEPAKSLEKFHTISLAEKRSLFVFILGFLILTLGISLWKWDTSNIIVSFILIGVGVGLAFGMSFNDICETFLAGCRKMMKGVIVIGIAATIRLILSDGNILDTVTFELTELVYHFPPTMQLIWIFLLNALINFLVTSGSAKAALVMPIITPMSDFLGLSRQSAVYAFQLGDGLTNLASPISTTLNGVMAVSDITYGMWIKFYAPLVGLYLLVGTILTLLAAIVGY